MLHLFTCHERIMPRFAELLLKFHTWIPHEKYLTHIFFIIWVIPLSCVMPLEKNCNDVSKISQKVFELLY